MEARLTYVKRLGKKQEKILRILSDGPHSGLEMVYKDSNLKRGLIYITLSKMEDEGLIESQLFQGPWSKQPCRLYDITEVGKGFLG